MYKNELRMSRKVDEQPPGFGFTRIGEEERRDGEAIALHKTHIWANSLKPVCFLCFLLFWCPLLPFIETGTLKIYTKMVLYMKNEIFDLKYPLHGVSTHTLPTLELCFSSKLRPVVDDLRENRSIIKKFGKSVLLTCSNHY